MSTADSVKTELAGLLTKANAATGNADTTIHDAVYALVEGYGQGGGGDIDALIDGSITEITSNVEKLVAYGFYYRTALISVNFPNVITISGNAFMQCTNLVSANFPKAESIVTSAFEKCTKLEVVNLPKVKSVGASGLIRCSSLTKIDLPNAESIGANAFSSCSSLTAVILRSETAVTLANANAFSSMPIKSSTGYIYVPAALVDTYKAATNWSTYANQFRALEDYTVDGTITGELDPNKI